MRSLFSFYRTYLALILADVTSCPCIGKEARARDSKALRSIKMEEYNGSTLTSNILAFGIIALCFVLLRLSFRLYTRKTSASDWVLVVALVSRNPLSHLGRETMRGGGARKLDIVVQLQKMT